MSDKATNASSSVKLHNDVSRVITRMLQDENLGQKMGSFENPSQNGLANYLIKTHPLFAEFEEVLKAEFWNSAQAA